MLLADLMVGTHDRPLEQAPDAFNGVGMHLAPHPFLLGVIDGQMLRIMIADALVRHPFIRNDLFRVGRCELLNEATKLLSGSVRNDAHPHITATLNDACNNGFIGEVVAAPAPAYLLSTDEGFIRFDRSFKQLRGGLRHSGTDTMTEIPRGLVGHTDHALHLVGGNALFGFDGQVDRHKPFLQGQVRIVEDRSCRDRELVAA